MDLTSTELEAIADLRRRNPGAVIVRMLQPNGEITLIAVDQPQAVTPATAQARADVLRVKYNRLDREHSTPLKGSQDKCTICQMSHEATDLVAWLPCGHLHHAGCLDEWLRRKGKCTQCPYQVADKAAGEGTLEVNKIEEVQCKNCQKVTRGHMVRCERKRFHLPRRRRWYHAGCVDQDQKVGNRWYCPSCWNRCG